MRKIFILSYLIMASFIYATSERNAKSFPHIYIFGDSHANWGFSDKQNLFLLIMMQQKSHFLSIGLLQRLWRRSVLMDCLLLIMELKQMILQYLFLVKLILGV